MTHPHPTLVAHASEPLRPWLFAAGCAGMFTFGMVIALLGALFGQPAMRERLAINLAQQGDLFAILSIGLLISSVISGPALQRFGAKRVLVSAAAMVAAALFAFAFARGFGAAASAAALLGFGGSWLNVGTNALVSDVFHEERGRWLNVLGAFFGVGALFVPLVVAIGLSIPATMAACAVVAATCGVGCAALHFPAHQAGGSFSVLDMLRAARHPGVALFGLLLFFQSGNEGSLSGWVATYIGQVGWSPRAANAVLLGYWVMAIVGRSASAWTQRVFGKSRLVLVSGLLSVAGCLVLLLAAGSLPMLTLGAWLAALAFSAVFPTALAIVGDRYPGLSGMVFGFLFSVANVGAILFPWGVGHLSHAYGIRLGMLIPLAGTIGVCACAVAVMRDTRQE